MVSRESYQSISCNQISVWRLKRIKLIKMEASGWRTIPRLQHTTRASSSPSRQVVCLCVFVRESRLRLISHTPSGVLDIMSLLCAVMFHHISYDLSLLDQDLVWLPRILMSVRGNMYLSKSVRFWVVWNSGGFRCRIVRNFVMPILNIYYLKNPKLS